MISHSTKIILTLGLVAALSCPARAADTVTPVDNKSASETAFTNLSGLKEYPMAYAPTTHHMLRMLSARSKVVHLDEPGSKVVIDNPDMLRAFMPDPKTVNLLAHPKEGITRFTVYGKDGKVVMSRYVALLTVQGQRYVRAKVVCGEKTAGDASCGRPLLFYCGGECFETETQASR